MDRLSIGSLRTSVNMGIRLLKSQKYKAIIVAVIVPYVRQIGDVVRLLDRLAVKSDSGIAFLAGYITSDNKFRVGYFE
jgi:hypothetical protein